MSSEPCRLFSKRLKQHKRYVGMWSNRSNRKKDPESRNSRLDTSKLRYSQTIFSIAKMFIRRFHRRFMARYQITCNVALTVSCLRARALIDRANSIDRMARFIRSDTRTRPKMVTSRLLISACVSLLFFLSLLLALIRSFFRICDFWLFIRVSVIDRNMIAVLVSQNLNLLLIYY